MTMTTTTPEQMTHEELEWFLAEHLEGLRVTGHSELCPEYGRAVKQEHLPNSECGAHVPHVTLELLLVAMAEAGFLMKPEVFAERRETKVTCKVIIWRRIEADFWNWGKPEVAYGASPLQAAMVAATKALMARESVVVGRIEPNLNTTS